MMRRAAVVLLGAVACMATGCSSDGAASTPTSSTLASTSTTGASAASATAVVNAYVKALSGGDIAAANALRCDLGKVPDASLASFTTAVAPLRDQLGGALTAGDVQLVQPITLASLSGATPDAQVAFALDDAGKATSMLALAVVTENGAQRVCGAMQEGAPGVMDQVQKAEFTPVLAQVPSLSIGIPVAPLPNATQVEDRAMTDLSSVPGASEGYTRAWSLPDGGGLRITALRAENFQGAITIARASLAASGLDAAEYLTSLPSGFIGVSEVANAWTWVHPASIGGRNDRAAGVVNDTTFVVEVSGGTAGKGHQRLIDAVTSLELG